MIPSITVAVPQISVVICTRNRPDKIGAAVTSVLANDHPAFDLTVVDQSTTTATGELMLAIVENDPRLTYLHDDEPGLSCARNTGIHRTTGPIIAFTDDDCIVPMDWLRLIQSALDADPAIDLLYGDVVAKSRVSDDRALTPALCLGKTERLSRHHGFRVIGMGANFAARRRLFSTIGDFDEALGGGGPLRAAEDFDLAYRTYHAGFVILLQPEVTLLHDGRREREDWPALLRNYGIGDGAFYAKHARCGDMYALSLLLRRIWSQGIRVLLRPVLGRESWGEYVAGLLVGIRDGFRFKVDRHERRYTTRRKVTEGYS